MLCYLFSYQKQVQNPDAQNTHPISEISIQEDQKHFYGDQKLFNWASKKDQRHWDPNLLKEIYFRIFYYF